MKSTSEPTLRAEPAARILALPPLDVAVITLVSTMPTGANAYVFTTRQGSAETSVGTAVALTTIASAVSITIILAALGHWS